MPVYSATFTRTASATLSVGALTAATSNPRRATIIAFGCGHSGAPTDVSFLWQIQRCTSAGTAGSSVTPQALNPADTIAATMVGGQAHSSDPALTANAILLDKPLHCRASYEVELSPRRVLITPATASNGLAFRTPTIGSAIAVSCFVHYDE